jgi:hypothetical protein
VTDAWFLEFPEEGVWHLSGIHSPTGRPLRLYELKERVRIRYAGGYSYRLKHADTGRIYVPELFFPCERNS